MKKKMIHLTAIATLFLSMIALQSANFKSHKHQNIISMTFPEIQSVVNSPVVKSGYLNFTFKPDNIYYKPGSTDTHFVYTHIKADTYNPSQVQRLPLNICLVIDRSGSMSGDRIANVKKAAEFVVNNLSSEDYLSIVIYDHHVQVLKSPTLIKDKQHFLQLIQGINVSGATNLCGGLTEGYNQIKSNYKEGYVNRVLLLSDGLANQGITDPITINQFAKTANQQNGITTSTFGVGNDFNENLMMGIAESGAGNYYYIGNPEQIPAIFDKELSGLLRVVAQNTRVKIAIPQGIRIVQLYGYTNIGTASDVIEILLRDISSDEEKVFLFSYVIDSSMNSTFDFSAIMNYDDAVNNNPNQNILEKFSVMPNEHLEEIAKNMDTGVITQYAVFHANWLMTQAMQFVDRGQIEQANALLGQNEIIKTKYDSYILNSAEFKVQDSLIINYNNNLKHYEKMSEQEKKVYQKSNKNSNYIIQKKK
jgi:Ca-activated chloride channel homolog